MSSFSKSSNTSRSRKPVAIAKRHLFVWRLQQPRIRSRQELSDWIAKESLKRSRRISLTNLRGRVTSLAASGLVLKAQFSSARGFGTKARGSDHKSHMKTGKRIEKYDLISQSTTVVSPKSYAGRRFVVPARERRVSRRLIVSPHGANNSHSTICLSSLHHIPLNLHSVHLFHIFRSLSFTQL
jgi:hypothetical protein